MIASYRCHSKKYSLALYIFTFLNIKIPHWGARADELRMVHALSHSDYIGTASRITRSAADVAIARR